MRGEDAEQASHPLSLLEFLSVLCEARSGLRIYLLAWDFSIVYARERESGQAEKFNGKHPKDTQEDVLNSLLEAARETGHELRLLYPASRHDDGSETPTFIHSKILIVDDQFLMIARQLVSRRRATTRSQKPR